MMNASQLAARSKGGKSRAQRYSNQQLVTWAKLGGRPRNLTIDDIGTESQINNKRRKTNH